jgi:hypothetical protein
MSGMPDLLIMATPIIQAMPTARARIGYRYTIND